MKNKIIYILTFVFILTTQTSQSGVNLKNGNFYISYTDIVLPGPFTFEITRTYNSKSTEVSVFGIGWGFIYSTKMQISGDGSLLVREHGAGGKTYFNPMINDPMLLDNAINELTRAARENGDLRSPAEILEFKTKLRENVDFRNAQWKRYLSYELVENPEFENGFKWNSLQRGNQEIIKTDSGFLRKQNDGLKELFNMKGELTQYITSKGVIHLEYNEKGNLVKLCDDLGRKIDFIYDENDKLLRAIGSDLNGEEYKAEYRLNDQNQLIYNADAVRNHYRYYYDQYSNMTKIVYNPIRTEETPEDAQTMEYYPETFYIKKITDRDGEWVLYEYESYFDEMGKDDDNHYATRVLKLDYYGDTTSNFYEYEIGVKENGERYSKKIKTIINGIETETTYNECCGLPIRIVRNGYETTFTYNNKGLVTEKVQGDKIIRMDYHPELDKMTMVSYYYPGEEKAYNWTKFDYNDKGNLIRAENEEEWVELVYNEEQKITEMITDGRTLVFLYNEIGKPTRIEIENVGAIDVTYDKWGEIESVNSDDGHMTALEVTQAFQNLLALVKPAGVNLNM